MTATTTIDEVYEWPIKAAAEKYHRYIGLYKLAPYKSRRGRAYLGLARKWARQYDALVAQYEKAKEQER